MGRRNCIPAVSEKIDNLHRTDQYVGILKPWVASSTKHIEKDREYFCVATWGTMHMFHMPKFWCLTNKIGLELHGEIHGKHLVGETRQVSTWGISDFRAETFTVWHEREHMAAFYKSGAHRDAMMSMKDKTDFRVRRCWVKGADIPSAGDSEATRSFVLRIKSGEFPEAKKA